MEMEMMEDLFLTFVLEIRNEKIDDLPDLQERARMSAERSIEDGKGDSPLEQFSIHPFILMKMGNFYFSFTNPSLSMLLTLGLVLLL